MYQCIVTNRGFHICLNLELIYVANRPLVCLNLLIVSRAVFAIHSTYPRSTCEFDLQTEIVLIKKAVENRE